ncbi:MAG: VanZ family protein [Epsilonproteobacteria bacterium]|nr:MAG: VanZ family protein [Campylobacterota bacterium]
MNFLFKVAFFTALTAISILAVVPNYNALPEFVSFSDLLNHALAFFTLYLLLERAYPDLKQLHAILLLLLYAILIEFIQSFLPNRFAALSDVLADSAGIVAALIILPFIKKFPLCRYCYPSKV